MEIKGEMKEKWDLQRNTVTGKEGLEAMNKKEKNRNKKYKDNG